MASTVLNLMLYQIEMNMDINRNVLSTMCPGHLELLGTPLKAGAAKKQSSPGGEVILTAWESQAWNCFSREGYPDCSGESGCRNPHGCNLDLEEGVGIERSDTMAFLCTERGCKAAPPAYWANSRTRLRPFFTGLWCTVQEKGQASLNPHFPTQALLGSRLLTS
ncbi:hypothetical protein A6R68_00256 [Neotoma lepida]|uniref:Uncharacterized protein n=1 Tax=Neotoma lepida TaxID=56216 RepID=A0A1A6H028_NEOLE|nr:hypothetical protein A6R68_00256 [Neotoma lepida]